VFTQSALRGFFGANRTVFRAATKQYMLSSAVDLITRINAILVPNSAL
jgi:hypothetical protein